MAQSRVLKVAAIQLTSGVAPEANVAAIADFAREAVRVGAAYILTPEVSLAFARDREELMRVAGPYHDNPALASLSALAAELGVHLHIGSLAVALDRGRFANRSVLFGPDGAVVAHYDKIHLFDADPPGDKPYRESAVYDGGGEAVVADLGLMRLGLSICYDVRFPALYQMLAEDGAEVMAVPAAFTVPTGRAHWEILLRARAIETGSFVIAAAQGGAHENGRQTYGHSMIIDPWGQILSEKADDRPGVIVASLDMAKVAEARARIPALANRRVFSLSVNQNPPE